jgi:hypothetical protein
VSSHDSATCGFLGGEQPVLPSFRVIMSNGRACADAVTDDYPGDAPWQFTGGTINRVAVDVSGEPYVDLEREAVAMLSRE